MKWEDIKKTYPDKFLLLKSLAAHIIGDKKYIDELAVVKVIDNPNEATELLVRCKGDTFVYHTAKEKVVIEIVMNPVYRGAIENESKI